MMGADAPSSRSGTAAYLQVVPRPGRATSFAVARSCRAGRDRQHGTVLANVDAHRGTRRIALLDMVLLCFIPHPSVIRWRAGAWPPIPLVEELTTGLGCIWNVFSSLCICKRCSDPDAWNTTHIGVRTLRYRGVYCCWLCSGKHNTSADVRGHGAVLVERIVGRTHYCLRPFGNTL
jgi:hypothetical protein